MRPGYWAVAALFPVVVGGSLLLVVLPLTGGSPPLVAIAISGLFLALAAVAAAALAAVALTRREWIWAAALILLWPVVLPAYVGRLLGLRRSGEADA